MESSKVDSQEEVSWKGNTGKLPIKWIVYKRCDIFQQIENSYV